MKNSLKLDTLLLLLLLLLAVVILGCAKGNNQEAIFSPSDPADTSPSGSADATGGEKPIMFGWKKVTSHAAFSARFSHQVMVFNDKMYLIDGANINRLSSGDVWSSTDGIIWQQINRLSSGDVWSSGSRTEQTKISTRYDHQVVVFKDRMYIIGGLGQGGYGYASDIWRSANGINWTKLSSSPEEMLKRYAHQLVVFKGTLYLIAGLIYNESKNDIWSSSDGDTWHKETDQAPFPARDSHQVVVFKNKIYLIAGSNESSGKRLNDVWSSSNGKSWTQETKQAPFSARSSHQVVVFNDKMYLIAGVNNSKELLNDIWSSTDGKNWTQETDQAPFSARYYHQVVVFKNKMYLIGGLTNTAELLNDVWSYGALD